MIHISVNIFVINKNQETLYLQCCNLAYECVLDNIEATLHCLELQLVKGLCQKYKATLGCHSTFVPVIHGGVADVICLC